MATWEILGETFTLTSGENGTQYVYEGAFDLSLVMFYSSSRDFVYVVWNNDSSTVEEMFTFTPSEYWDNSMSLSSLAESGFEALGLFEDEIRESGYDDYPEYEDDDRYDTYESDGYAMIGGDSDLMNEW